MKKLTRETAGKILPKEIFVARGERGFLHACETMEEMSGLANGKPILTGVYSLSLMGVIKTDVHLETSVALKMNINRKPKKESKP